MELILNTESHTGFMPRLKGLTVLLLPVVAFGFAVVLLPSCKRTEQPVYEPNSIRPNDFPAILVAPGFGEVIDYVAPPRSAHRTYGLKFEVNDPYPAVKTQAFIKQHLTSNGWHLLKYSLFCPYAPRNPEREWSQYSYPPDLQILGWKEEWLNSKGESITVILEYSWTAADNQDLRLLWANLFFHETGSQMDNSVLSYKKLHPEELHEIGDMGR